jgi:predicted RNA-binding Zn-ribbon protein involved in translation (DUF1610 family)
MPRTATPKAKEGMVQALFEFGYDERLGQVCRGQVFELGGHTNDERLVTLRYVAPVKKGVALSECGECGRLFIDDAARTAHGDLFHQYECDGCGWAAGREFPDRRGALERHRQSCSAVISARETRRKAHMKEVADIKAAQPVEVGA